MVEVVYRKEAGLGLIEAYLIASPNRAYFVYRSDLSLNRFIELTTLAAHEIYSVTDEYDLRIRYYDADDTYGSVV